LKIVGICDKEYEKELRAIADGYGCAEYVDFIHAQKDVKPFFSQAMAFINSSVNEGMGRTTAEAMFYGCPVIAYASGGTMDLVRDGETGYLFNTVEECAELMRKVCTTDQEDIILRAQEFAKQNLSIENYAPKIMEVYNLVLKTK
jgi:glycosyltransferase involved in cell wall biosynthesis